MLKFSIAMSGMPSHRNSLRTATVSSGCPRRASETLLRNMRQQISSALDLVVHTARLTDGTRKVVGVTEVVGMEGDMIMVQELFTYQREGTDADGRVVGRFLSTGIRPRFAERVKSSSHDVDMKIFEYLG